MTARDGRLYAADDETRSESLCRHHRARRRQAEVEGKGNAARPPEDAERYAMYSHGAVFAEVKIDPELFQMRVTRLVGAFAAGRIINPMLAESQLMGGMIWGLSFALHEEARFDKRTGRIVNADLPAITSRSMPTCRGWRSSRSTRTTRYVNALGIKGVGEIGVTGTVGAIGNAIWHATGKRIRRFPIRIEDLLVEPA